MPTGHDGIGKKTKKAWRMRVKAQAGSTVGKGGGRAKKEVLPPPPKKPKKEERRGR